MATFFTSDWHLNEDRIGINDKPNLFYRPFKSIDQQNLSILQELEASEFKDGDTLWHLGDVVYSFNRPDTRTHGARFVLQRIKQKYPNSKFHLIIGNYDEDKLDKLSEFFDTMQHEACVEIDGLKYYLNHYPIKCVDQFNKKNNPYNFAITGHIHGLWKVQPYMINVGVDAWHFKPVSEKEIVFATIACQKFYDENVFPHGKI